MPKFPVLAAALIAISAISALAVFAVYVNLGGERNVAGPGAAAPAAPDSAARLASFVVHDSPRPVADVSFQSADGSTRTLAEWRGRAVLVNLWATWCAPCRHEMPALDRLQKRLGGATFEVVTISLDRGGFDQPRAFFEEIGIENLALYNEKSSTMLSTLGVVGMPTTLLIDAEGREIGRVAGPVEWDAEEAVAMITRLAALGS